MRPSQQGPSVCLCVRACVCCVEGVTGGAFAVPPRLNASNSRFEGDQIGANSPSVLTCREPPLPRVHDGPEGKVRE